MRRWEIASIIARAGVIAIVRAPDADSGRRRAELLLELGIPAVEVSLTTPGALGVITQLRDHAPAGAVVGAGTVLDAASARLVVEAGAQFVVCPTLSAPVLATAHRYGLATVAGAGSPTEIITALEAGADFVKLFPASVYGPTGMGHVLQALPQAALVPTGGVSIGQVGEYLAAGAAAVGLGSSLTAGSATDARARITELLARLAERADPR